MVDPYRDPWGRLCVDPDTLPLAEKVRATRQLAGTLQASDDRLHAWAGQRIATGLRTGGSFASVFGLVPEPGRRRTAARLLREEHVARVLLRLAAAAGSAARASRILGDLEPCPSELADLVAEARELKAPTSLRAFTRVRHRVT